MLLNLRPAIDATLDYITRTRTGGGPRKGAQPGPFSRIPMQPQNTKASAVSRHTLHTSAQPLKTSASVTRTLTLTTSTAATTAASVTSSSRAADLSERIRNALRREDDEAVMLVLAHRALRRR